MSEEKAYFSNNNNDWIIARDYQRVAVIQAIKWYDNIKSGSIAIYKYIKDDIIFTLTPFSVPSKNNMEKVFVMTRDNGTIAYLKLVKDRYTKMLAQPGSTVTAEYFGNTININTGETYYIDNSTNKIAVGWHGSYNPPCGMDGNSLV